MGLDIQVEVSKGILLKLNLIVESPVFLNFSVEGVEDI